MRPASTELSSTAGHPRPGQLLAAVALVAFASACSGGSTLADAAGELSIAGTEVAFPPTFVGYPTGEHLALSNTGRATITVELSLTGPFGAERARVELAGGDRFPLPLAFAPLAPGPATGRLLVALEGTVTEVTLTGTALAAPRCSTRDPCERSLFDPASGLCHTFDALPFSPCSSGNLCQNHEVCSGGACVGVPIDCDDENVCTSDACDASSGCTHRDDSGHCPGSSNPCRLPACDPEDGCGLTDARDGTLCGFADCATANICIFGSCVEVETPEGTPCSAACGPGQCQGGSCSQPGGDVLAELFRVETAGIELELSGVADPDGGLFFREFWNGGCSLGSVDPDGGLRFRQELGLGLGSRGTQPLLLSGDRIWLATGSRVEARGRDDGLLLLESELAPLLEPDLARDCPGCWLQVVALAEAGDGEVAAAVVVRGSLEPRGHLVLVTGWGLRFALPQAGALGRGSLLAGADGSLFLGLTRFADPQPVGELVAFDPEGGELWRRTLPPADLPPVLAATAEGVVILASGHALRTSDGSDAYWLPLPPGTVGRAPLLTSGLGYWFAGSAEAAISTAFDPASGALIEELGLTALLGPGSEDFSDPLLTAGGSALLLVRRGQGAHELLELQPGRGAVRRCAVPTDGPVAGLRLLGGKLLLQVNGLDGSTSLRAFRLPGSDAAPSGWIGPDGNLGGGRRPQ